MKGQEGRDSRASLIYRGQKNEKLELSWDKQSEFLLWFGFQVSFVADVLLDVDGWTVPEIWGLSEPDAVQLHQFLWDNSIPHNVAYKGVPFRQYHWSLGMPIEC